MEGAQSNFGPNQPTDVPEPPPAGMRWVALREDEHGDVGDWALYAQDMTMTMGCLDLILPQIDDADPTEEQVFLSMILYRMAMIAYGRAFVSDQRADLASSFQAGLSGVWREAHEVATWFRNKHAAHSTSTLDQVTVLIAVPEDGGPVDSAAALYVHAGTFGTPDPGHVRAMRDLAARAYDYFFEGMRNELQRVGQAAAASITSESIPRPTFGQLPEIPAEHVRRESRRSR